MMAWTDEILIDGVNLRLVASDNGFCGYCSAFPGRRKGDTSGSIRYWWRAASQLRAYFAAGCGNSTCRSTCAARISSCASGTSF